MIGIGASAGGVDALQKFFSSVRDDSGMAYVVVLHLSPTHESELAAVLQRAVQIPVVQVSETVPVHANHVYVLAPNRSLTMRDGSLALSPITSTEERRAPIDIFFRTLADSLSTRAGAVVLSGTGADGSMGMKRVKEMGGVTLVQDPGEAQYSDMPRHCIATGLVDYVLPAAAIAPRLQVYIRTLHGVEVVTTAEAGEPGADYEQQHEWALRSILTTLRTRTSQDFSNYKRSTLLRRIARRTSVRELPDLPSYAEYLREHVEETQPLLKDLLISVTNFFRDVEAWRGIEASVIPRIFDDKGREDHVRVWVAGCATGEEAYSFAMLLAEHAATMAEPPSLQVFATDIDEGAIAFAREGLYTLNDAADVSVERLRRFFVKEGDNYRVRRELREMVLFAQHNLIKDPPFSHLDLASCRNLLIYLNRTGQRRALEVMHFALSPGGYLVLGTSESVEGASDLYVEAGLGQQIFRRRAVEARMTFPVPELAPTVRRERHITELFSPERRAADRLSYADLHQRLLEEYAPPSVVVNEQQEIVHMSARAGRYMQLVGGDPTHNLLKLIRPELRLELRTALHEAMQRRMMVEARNLSVRSDEGAIEHVNIVVRPVLADNDTQRGFALVIFTPATPLDVDEPKQVLSTSAEPIARQLEDELNRVKNQLRVTIEQWEIQTEELRSSNEELQAMNEELSSAAEELETRKEELQSVNEELTTVNQELKVKIDELSETNNDIRNLINSTDIGTLFLDRALCIKLFTPRARDLFNLILADVGRPLSDIRTRLQSEELTSTLERVLETLQPVEREVTTDNGCTYVMKLVPYRTSEDRIEGVVMTFVDITDRRNLEEQREQLLESERAARVGAEGATRLKNEFLATLSHEMRTPLSVITSWAQLLDSKFATVDPQLRRGLALIGSSAFALSQLISDLLDIARMQTGKLMLDMTTVDLRDIAAAAVQAQRPEAERKGIALEFVAELEAAPIHGDLTRLQQVFWNLISNAIKFTPEGGSVEVRLDLADRDYEVKVKDTGAGIPPEFLPHVFERFRQWDASTSRSQGGLGLGLAIVQQLVDLHGGTVTASSDGPGKGATFTLRLPIWSRSVRSRALSAAVPMRSASRHTLDGTHVMIVDDSVELLESLKRELEDHGAAVADCRRGDTALELLRKMHDELDAIVVDIGMPGMDGYALMQTIRQKLAISPDQLPAIALTAFGREEDRRGALAAGYQTHIAKPYRITDIVSAIAELRLKKRGGGQPRGATAQASSVEDPSRQK